MSEIRTRSGKVVPCDPGDDAYDERDLQYENPNIGSIADDDMEKSISSGGKNYRDPIPNDDLIRQDEQNLNDLMERDIHKADDTNIARGYKATLKNPRVSDEAKANAQRELEERGLM
ncbi:hypothetical protein CVT24_011838 [Panaeolus cyanescens]|uniref:Uncharacterized protein n=1 Tax=Panaeolus cyanescens TaxID=181874 RepID=A0A409YP13_9AGAR|nr:hypothetical protein CVT24_011838 [Panaeolus cyanescens]